MKRIYSIFLILLYVCSTYSQNPEKRNIGPDGFVFDMDSKGDTLYVGGDFDKVGYITGGAALFTSGDTNPEMDFPYIRGQVFACISDGSGGWYLGGNFIQAGLWPCFNLVHIFSDFEVDTAFKPVVNNRVNALFKDSNRLYFGGQFTTVDEQDRKYFAAYNLSTNTLDNFNPLLNNKVFDIQGYNNDLIIAGSFSQAGDSLRRGLVCLDKSSGVIHNFPVIASGQVNDMVKDNQTLYVAGNFSGGLMAIDLVSRTKTSWNPVVTGNIYGMRVNAITKSGSIIYFGGQFVAVNGTGRIGMAAVNESGTLVADFNPSPDDEVFGIFAGDNFILAGGDFLNIDGKNLAHIAKISLSGVADPSWNLRPDWSAHTFAGFGNQVLIGGEFIMLQKQDRNNAYAIDLKTNQLLDWNPVGNFLNVSLLKVDKVRNVVYMAGWDSQTSEHLKAFDGDKGLKLSTWNTVFNNSVSTLDQDAVSGNIYVGGSFTTINGQTRKYFAAFDAGGSLLSAAPEFDAKIKMLDYSENSQLVYVSGDFNTINGITRYKYAALDASGNVNSWDPHAALLYLPEPYIKTNCILALKDRIFISGSFDSIQHTFRPRLAAVDPVTAALLPWDPSIVTDNETTGEISYISEFQDYLLVKGSANLSLSGAPLLNFATISKYSGVVLDNFSSFNLKNLEEVSVTESVDSNLILGGSFISLQNTYYPFYARLNFPSYGSHDGRIERYTPTSGGNVGDVTMVITGTDLIEGTVITLRKTGFDDITAAQGSVFYHKNATVTATFDLRGALIGSRDIVVQIPGDTTIIIEDGFTIETGTGALPWADMVCPTFVTRGAKEFFYLNYGNSGDVDALGVPVWIAFSPNIDVKEINLDVIRLMDENDPYYDSIPDYILIDSLSGEPYPAKVYGFIIPKIPAGSSFTIPILLQGAENGSFYTRAWVEKPFYGSPLKYWVGECYDALILYTAGYVPFAGCALGVVDLVVSPFVDYAWDPNFGSGTYVMNYIELSATTFLECAGDAASGGLATAVKVVKNLLSAKSYWDIYQKCQDPEQKDDNNGEFVSSCDPNDKSGPAGQGQQNWLTTDKTFNYMIRFENKADASAPAKTVVIIDTIDFNVLDTASLKLKGYTIADEVYMISNGGKEFSQIIDLRPRLPYYVQVSAKLDVDQSILRWEFVTLDTINKEPVNGAMEGFLPPDTDSISGRGSIFFDIQVKKDILSGTEINNRAHIFFDNNDDIVTNLWSVIADNVKPESKVNELNESVEGNKVNLTWNGTDIGSGIRGYDIMYRKNGGNWYYAASNTADTLTEFVVNGSGFYEFYSLAHDQALNKEYKMIIPDASTYVNTGTTGIAEAGYENNPDNTLEAYPNPVRDVINIRIGKEMSESEQLEISLLDLVGNIVISRTLNKPANKEIELDVQQVKSGVYLIQVKSLKVSETIKVLILNQ